MIYALALLTIRDQAAYDRYRAAFLPTLRGTNGRLLAATDEVRVAEGDRRPERVVLLGFPDEADFRAWYDSEAYQAILPDRHTGAEGTILLFDGLDQPHGKEPAPAGAAAERAAAGYEERIRASFANQGLMRTLGASLGRIAPGSVEIVLPPGPAITQQHGLVHAGAVSAVADTAAGYAALTLMPEGAGVLTAEFKINLLAPAVGDRILARGTVVKAGRTLTVAQTEVVAETGGEVKPVALLTATLMTVTGRGGLSD